MNHRIPPEAIEALMKLSFSGNKATMPQMPRDLYVKVNKVLELAGGKWNKSAKAHIFPDDAEDIIADAISTGEILDRKKTLQYFPTPDSLADEMVQLARIIDDEHYHILEPSAGDGSLIRAIRRRFKNPIITAIEIDPTREKSLKDSGANMVCIGDFLSACMGPYDSIVANPPFRNGQDVQHVMKMWDHLEPAGRLVTLTSPAWTFRTNQINRDFRTWLGSKVSTHKSVPAGTFSDTGIRTELLVLKK